MHVTILRCKNTNNFEITNKHLKNFKRFVFDVHMNFHVIDHESIAAVTVTRWT